MRPPSGRRAIVGFAAVVFVCTTSPLVLSAQADSTISSGISTRTMARIGVITALTAVAVMPFDAHIARQMQLENRRGGRVGSSIANTFNAMGDPGSVIAPLGLMTLGWATHRQSMLDVGIHSAESVVLGSGVTAIIKGTAGRARPTPGSTDADDFSAGSGFSNNQHSSFPSGHTTAAFALATTLAMESSRYAPDHAKAITIASYTFATGVGFARMYSNRHWASDVVLGAGIGTLSGLVVERHALNKLAQRSSLARHVVPSSINAVPHGDVALGWDWTF